jgi:hypothetical protein
MYDQPVMFPLLGHWSSLYQRISGSRNENFPFIILDVDLSKVLYLRPTFISLSGVGTTCFPSCRDKDLAIIFYDQPPA